MSLDIMQAGEEGHEARIRMSVVYLHHRQQEVNSISRHRGSTFNHCVFDRSREEGHARLYRDYFSNTPTYTEAKFYRRFRMQIESLKRFVKAIIEVCGAEYLRQPNDEDVSRLLRENEQRGFSGMLGSIDCHVHELTIILEAITSKDLWIWHSFLGLPGSLNDINVLDRSHLFKDLAEGRGPEVRFTVNGYEYYMGYYLVDGIYPSWPIFVKTVSKPQDNKRKHFAHAQESFRKDVERAFGVLQSRLAIIRGPSRFWIWAQ
ncbi:uncharacterized protein LOC141688819 [Apium graveolens]|uniref:uncharacterized protein LOC141688819 n=1 Tax=Apium graveolens TaxID=4045 RepID=UPI003D79F822